MNFIWKGASRFKTNYICNPRFERRALICGKTASAVSRANNGPLLCEVESYTVLNTRKGIRKTVQTKQSEVFKQKLSLSCFRSVSNKSVYFHSYYQIKYKTSMGNSDSDSSEILHIRKRRSVPCLLSSSDENKSDGTEEDCSSENESEEDFSSSASELDDEPSGDSQSEENQTKRSEWDTEENNRAPFDLSENSGQQFDVPTSSRKKCLFYLDKLLDNEFISIIVEQTNLYAQYYLENHNLKPRSRMKNWHWTNYNEMRCFIAMLILQGIIRKPTLQMYFSKRESVSTPFFSKVLAAERFLLLCKFLHFADNRNLASASKISNKESSRTVRLRY